MIVDCCLISIIIMQQECHAGATNLHSSTLVRTVDDSVEVSPRELTRFYPGAKDKSDGMNVRYT